MDKKKKMLSAKAKKGLPAVGWREWVSLPDLGIGQIKVKIDTGARTSALHAFAITPFKQNQQHYIRFKIRPLQRCNEEIECVAKVEDIRWVTDSGGHRERRYVIVTQLVLGAVSWPIEVTLTNRDTMSFRMLLGRTAMRNRCIVNPAVSFVLLKKL